MKFYDAEINKLKSECKRLKKCLVEKDVIISALIEKITKESKENTSEHTEFFYNEDYADINENSKCRADPFPIIKENKNESMKAHIFEEDNLCFKKIENKKKSKDAQEEQSYNTDKIIYSENADFLFESPYKEILEIAYPQEKETKLFKQSFDFKTFIDYVSKYNTKGKNEKQILTYASNNRKGILKFIFDNIESQSLSEIYYSISTVISHCTKDEKLILMHDMIIHNCKSEWLTTILYVIIKSEQNWTGEIYSVIQDIFSYQLSTDIEFCAGNYLLNNFFKSVSKYTLIEPIKINFIEKSKILIKEVPLFNNKHFSKEIFDRSTALKLISIYMDWDFTYNDLICDLLGLCLKESTHPAHVFYLGMLTITGMKMVGLDSSINGLTKALEEYLEHKNLEVGIAAYIFLKQIKFNNVEWWLEKHQYDLENLNVDISMLKNFIC